MDHPLTLIVLSPLVGFLLNGVLATRLGGVRFGNGLVSVIGCSLPIASFAIAVRCLLELQSSGAPLIETAYTWATIGGGLFGVAFYFDCLWWVVAVIVSGD